MDAHSNNFDEGNERNERNLSGLKFTGGLTCKEDADPLFLSVQQVADLLGVSYISVNRSIRSGEFNFKVIRLGRRWLIHKKSFYDWYYGMCS